MHLYTEAKAMAQEALEQSEGDFESARGYLFEKCDGHEIAIYYHKAIQFCAEQDTSDGEEWLEDCGGIVQPGDTFGKIACRIAFATLYCAANEALNEMEKDKAHYETLPEKDLFWHFVKQNQRASEEACLRRGPIQSIEQDRNP